MMRFVRLIATEADAPPGTGIYNPSDECSVPGLLCCQYTDDDDNAPIPDGCIYAARVIGEAKPEVLLASPGYVIKQAVAEMAVASMSWERKAYQWDGAKGKLVESVAAEPDKS